ncbi:MAG: carbamate kinase [Candidatus Latescibacteria bacterium]|nr:carbamate kinase [Candidatus Latescibacterota bacterium]
MGKISLNAKTIVVAIGGNSLIRNGSQSTSFDEQLETVKETTQNIADIIEQGYRVVITHGNGPQVGDILIRSYLTRNHMPDIPLDMANAITQSQIGYMIQQSLKNELLSRKIKRDVVTVITQVIVDKKDPAFSNYTKPVGPFYSKKEAFTLQTERKWIMKEDAGRGFRRLVSSPQPNQIVELNEIQCLIESGVVVIAGGGGGIPVFRNSRGQLVPLSAVIDKDLTSALLANLIRADILLISTSVDCAYIYFNQPRQKPLYKITIKQAQKYLDQGHFGQGNMGPKISAGIVFIKNTRNRTTIITDPKNLSKSIFHAKVGTRIYKP